MRYDDFASQLQKELPAWVSAGLVSVEQSQALSLRDDAVSEVERRRSKAVQAIAVIGAVAAGLGVILFFAVELGRDVVKRVPSCSCCSRRSSAPTRRVVAARAPAARRPRPDPARWSLSAPALFLVGQMYHVQAHSPLGFAVWSCGRRAARLDPAVARAGDPDTADARRLGRYEGVLTALRDTRLRHELRSAPARSDAHGVCATAVDGLGSVGVRTWASGPMRAVRLRAGVHRAPSS